MSTAPADSNSFLKTTRENTDLNQYWYSSKTIHALIQEIQNCGAKRIAFLSTPSLYFSLTDETLQRNSCVFDYDDVWASHKNFVKYDFNKPNDIPTHLRHSFDMVVIDPPFITEEVWIKYAEAVQLLLPPKDGKQLVHSTSSSSSSLSSSASAAAPANQQEGKSSSAKTLHEIMASQSSSDKNDGTSRPSMRLDTQHLEDQSFNPFKGRSLQNDVAVTAGPASPPPTSSATSAPSTSSSSSFSSCASSSSPVYPPVPDGLVLVSSIGENGPMFKAMFGATPLKFRPSIPNLVYQYELFANFPTTYLNTLNPEVDE